jgi:hypothetical protein
MMPAVDPRRTSSIDPDRASNISGLYIFPEICQPLGLTAKADEEVIIILNTTLEWIGFLVATRDGDFNQLDLCKNRTRFLCNTGEESFNIFNVNREWILFTTR